MWMKRLWCAMSLTYSCPPGHGKGAYEHAVRRAPALVQPGEMPDVLSGLLCPAASVAGPRPSLWIYPLKLTGTAPNVALHLQAALPFSPAPLEALARSGEAAAATPEALRAALFSREQSWLWFLAACALAAWLITLAVQLLWRAGRRSAIQPARAARRAIRTYRLTLLWLCAVNAAFAAVVWLAGVRWIPGRTGGIWRRISAATRSTCWPPPPCRVWPRRPPSAAATPFSSGCNQERRPAHGPVCDRRGRNGQQGAGSHRLRRVRGRFFHARRGSAARSGPAIGGCGRLLRQHHSC